MLTLIVLGLVGLVVHQSIGADSAEKLIEVPLTSSTTLYSGSHGQPTTSYYAEVDIGSPPKSFKIQFDVDTNELFVPIYVSKPFNKNLHYGDGYKSEDSSSRHEEHGECSVVYQLGRLTGKHFVDLVALNGASWRQKFLAITLADKSFSQLSVDGFFGLGPAQRSPTGIKSIVHSLKENNLIDQLQFSIKLEKSRGHQFEGGAIIFGGASPNLYQGSLNWNELVPQEAHKWTISLDSVKLGEQFVSCSKGGCQAKFSSGVSDIYGPRRDVERIYSLLNAIKSPKHNFYTIDCRQISVLPAIGFIINETPYVLKAGYYIGKVLHDKKDMCYVAIMPSDADAITWTLSTPFLNAYYGVFDLANRRIGLAESS